MRLWDTLRTAFDLAQRVVEAERQVEELRDAFAEVTSEWTDTLDKLRAREERQRKRDQRAIKAGLAVAVDTEGRETPTGPVIPTDAAGLTREQKNALRARFLKAESPGRGLQ